jgi:hypothetical protein
MIFLIWASPHEVRLTLERRRTLDERGVASVMPIRQRSSARVRL